MFWLALSPRSELVVMPLWPFPKYLKRLSPIALPKRSIKRIAGSKKGIVEVADAIVVNKSDGELEP